MKSNEVYNFHNPDIAALAAIAFDLDALMALTNLSNATAEAMLQAITTTGLYLSIHTGNAAAIGQTGATEILGSGMAGYSSGGYTGTRMALTWGSLTATPGTVISNNTQTFPLLAVQASGILGFGIWTDTGASGHAGTFLTGGSTVGLSGSIPSGANVVFTNAITLTVSG